jgi:hypothetical protein
MGYDRWSKIQDGLLSLFATITKAVAGDSNLECQAPLTMQYKK